MAKAPAKPAAPHTSRTKATTVAAPPSLSARHTGTHNDVPPPIELAAVVGHQAAIATLRSAIGGGRLHHAWIFHGPPGIGKLTTARAFAAALLGVDAEHAAIHPDMHLVTRQTAKFHADADVRVKKQSTIPVEVLRDFVIDRAAIARSVVSDSAAGKVFVIDEADIMNTSGQNALLKTLEEPPPGTVLILVAASEDELLPTIRSRCQRVAFQPLSDAEMTRWLGAAGLDVPAAERGELLAFAAGSPGAAALAVEHQLLTWSRTLRPMLGALSAGGRADGMGSTMTKLVAEQVERTAEASPESSKEHINRLWTGRMIAFLSRWAQSDLRAAAASADARGAVAAARALRAIDLISDAQAQVESNVRFADVLDNLAMQLGVGSSSASR